MIQLILLLLLGQARAQPTDTAVGPAPAPKRAPITFETVSSVVPALEIGLEPGPEGLRLDVRYGNRRTQRVFGEP